MNKENILLSSIPIEDLREVFRDCIKAELEISARTVSQEPDELINEANASELTGISKVTLKKWRDEGKINFYRFGTRIRYKKAELVNSALISKEIKGGRVAL